MQLPVQSQSTLYVAEWETKAGVDELVQVAQAADRAGFFYVAVCDHVAIPDRLAPAMGTTWYDTIATLGLLAGVTERVRLMSHVWVLPYRHPLQSASSFASLDTLSKGRVILGIGAGHVAEEFALFGLDFEARGWLLDDALGPFDAALRNETVDGMSVAPRAVQQPRPPIWIGGSSRPAIRRAAKYDGWLPQGTPRPQMPEQIAYLRSLRGDEPFDLGTVCEFIYVGDPSWDVGKGVIQGKPDAIAESLREFVAMGVNQLQVRFKARSCAELVEQMEAFGSDVAPLLT
jgi:probable F420-dependent oxidoreductase